MDHGQRASDQAGGDSVGAACGPPQTVEKPMVLERAAFLASFGRSQRSRKMLRHKALGLCPKPRQARREARALWALGPKAQSDPKRGSETMRATVRECA